MILGVAAARGNSRRLLSRADAAQEPSMEQPLRIADAAPAMPPADSLITFWDELFCAVRARLQESIEGVAGRTGAAAQPMPDCVCDCVSALDQLQAALIREAGRGRWSEQALAHAQAELDRARAELAERWPDVRCRTDRPSGDA